MRSRGRCRGGTGGRSSLVDCGVRLIFEGWVTSRPGIRRGSLSRRGRHRRVPVTRSFVASLVRRFWAFLGARARPGSVPGAIVATGGLVKRGGLPEESGEFSGNGDRDHAGGLFPLAVKVLPALVQPAIGQTLARRQHGQDPRVIEIAWRAQRRLHQRWQRLHIERRKPAAVVAIAVARELTAFLWEAATLD